MRRAAKKDANHAIIVNGLRKVGVRVRVLNDTDLPDLLCAFRGVLSLVEIKDGDKPPSKRKLRPGQQRFADEWADCPVFKVETLGQAFNCLGIKVS